MSGKFEYFLNAIHYCMWLIDIKWGNFDRKIVIGIRSFILKHLCTNERRRKYEEFMNKEQEKIDELFYDQENGFHIGWANHWFGYFYSAYFSFFPLVISGLIIRETGELPYVGLLLLALSIGLGYIPAYRAVFTKDKYLKYFKKFKKKDGNWHKKWMWITIAFCFGSILTGGLGVLSAFLVAMS